jgi:hypothetical protein
MAFTPRVLHGPTAAEPNGGDPMSSVPPIPSPVFRSSSLCYWCLLGLVCALGAAYFAYGLRAVFAGILHDKHGRIITYTTEPAWFIIGVSLHGIIAGLLAFLAIATVAMTVSAYRLNRTIRHLYGPEGGTGP